MSDLFDQRLRNAARSLPTPGAPPALVERVLAERAAGARVTLPTSGDRRGRGRWVGLSAVAAGIVVASLLITSRSRRPPGAAANGADSVSSIERFFSSSGVLATTAFAQTPPAAPGAPPIAGIDLAAFDGKRLDYRIQFVDNAGRITPDGDGRVAIEHATYDGIAAWRVSHSATMSSSTGQRRTTSETLFVAQGDRRLLARTVNETPYLRFSGITIRQRFSGDSVSGEMSTDNDIRRPIARRLPPTFGPYISDALAPLGLFGIELSPRWRGSLSVVGWAVVPNDVFYPVTLWVVGEEVLSTPSGPVPCWKLRVSANPEQRTEWVRKSDGLALKSRDEGPPSAKGRREFVLLNP